MLPTVSCYNIDNMWLFSPSLYYFRLSITQTWDYWCFSFKCKQNIVQSMQDKSPKRQNQLACINIRTRAIQKTQKGVNGLSTVSRWSRALLAKPNRRENKQHLTPRALSISFFYTVCEAIFVGLGLSWKFNRSKTKVQEVCWVNEGTDTNSCLFWRLSLVTKSCYDRGQWN